MISLDQTIVFATQIICFFIAFLTLTDYLRSRDQPHLDIALLFFDFALIVLLQWLGELKPGLPAWTGLLASILLMAHPYLLLRLVQDLRPVSRGIRAVGLNGMLISFVLIVLYSGKLPVPVTLLIVAYYVYIEGASAFFLFQGAFRTRGVTRRRLFLAVGGSLFIAGLVLVSGMIAIIPGAAPVLTSLSHLIGLLSVVSYYFGFAPPGWLRRSWQLSELYQFLRESGGQKVSEQMDLLLKRLASAAERAVGSDVAGVALRNKLNHRLELACLVGKHDDIAPQLIIDLGHPLVEDILFRKQSRLVSSVDFREEDTPKPSKDEAWWWMLVPLVIRERDLGLLFVRLARVPLFASDDLTLLSLFCEQASIALGYGELLSEQVALVDQLRRYNQRLTSMKEIDRAILAVRTPHQIASTALAHLRRLVHYRRASVVLFDFDAHEAHWMAVDSPSEVGVPEGTVMPIADITTLDISPNNPQVNYIENTEGSEFHSRTVEQLHKQGIRSILTIPLVAEGSLIGELALSSTEAGAFPVEQQEIVREVATQLAIAIQQARMRGKLQDYADELEERVKDRTTQLEQAVESLQKEIEARTQATEALRAAQDRLKQRAAELNSANKELEAFAYSVSHDLRAPLRAIDGFSRILITKYASELSAEAMHYLDLVRSNTQQMGKLIDDLLSFSRLNRQEIKKEKIEPVGIVRLVLRELLRDNDRKKVKVTVGELPALEADPALLKQVFVNLLSNAVKFSSRREQPCVEVGSKRVDEEQVYFVRDNGVGFDMQYASKLFGVFQRLHRPEEFEGTGVGLAIVQRIINRHGGRVWAEAEPEKGATFYFTLPM